MVREINSRNKYLPVNEIDTVYFGGGTPSVLNVTELQKLLNAVHDNYRIKEKSEITLEANPDDINDIILKEWKDAGINRLSIGLQGFQNEELKWMNRAHNAEQALASVKRAQDRGFENITIDLIYGSKFQSLGNWEKTLQIALSLNTAHISSYNLTIENKTKLGHAFAKGNEPAVNDELSSRQFLMMVEMLEENGFIQYEISNFGKPGFFAQHNSNYWKGETYIGIGPSAHSFNGTTRQWNISNNNTYLKKLNAGEVYFEEEELSVNERYNEYVMTRLRTIWGCDTLEMKMLFGEELTSLFEKRIEHWKEFLHHQGTIYSLNLEGKLRADGIASDLFVV
jgi:oxygen-independent coproporphyrinogen-3 oxidase